MLMLHLVALRILEQVSKAMPTRARFRPPARVARSPPEGGGGAPLEVAPHAGAAGSQNLRYIRKNMPGKTRLQI